nr:reverse transcriptase domain-containing protein [Tanacetum cinerariifolium]
MDATNVEDPVHHRIAMIDLWEDPGRNKQTMHPEDIKEIIMVKILAIGAIVMKTKNQTLVRKTPPIPRLPEKKPEESEFKRTMREFVIAQKTTNDFVKNQFYNLKTKVKQGQKNHQAVIQDLETKFGRIFNHQSSRPT